MCGVLEAVSVVADSLGHQKSTNGFEQRASEALVAQTE